MKKLQNNVRGITLIALVITIVILVILVGVSVSAAINTGLIANSKKAVANYDKAQNDEKVELDVLGGDLEFNYSGKNLGSYIYSNGMITGLSLDTTAATFLGEIGNEYELYTKDGEKITDDNTIIVTGTIVKKGSTELAKVVILGDVDCNNVINSTDAGWIKSVYNDGKIVSDAQKVASDVNNDGVIDYDDAFLTQKEFSTSGTIEQKVKAVSSVDIITRTEKEWVESKAKILLNDKIVNVVKTEWLTNEAGLETIYEIYMNQDINITVSECKELMKPYSIRVKDADSKVILAGNIGSGYTIEFEGYSIKFIIES